MAKAKQQTIEKIPSELKISKEEADLRLKERIEKGKELLNIKITSELHLDEAKKEYRKWNDYNFEYLRRIFSTDEEATKYNRPLHYAFVLDSNLGRDIRDFFDDIKEKIHRIDSLVERIDLIPLEIISEASYQNITPITKKVFIVHGRDEVSKTNLEILLTEMGLEPIVLHRQADEGQTVIEKFEKYGSDVAYAFILLTPDEIAYLSNEDLLPDNERKKEKRARPNVIFEFGYFVGKLTRNRVCCLYTGDVEIPSDLKGLVYKRYNNSVEEVAYSIQKDLKAVGILN
ncbi:nucleotide-binding protein [Aliarcobacter butzleri]|uniref:nucleotide-binding protein n=1 Tax=Aliarcobacter butzleri TaxID=28197 RepID=UPI0021B540CC|nr:nucleotide-binding protein [Aliarcobacter butzleri]MCT7621936.1 nucleotide-binding protein [Aliarcobacter butzleri]